MTSDELFSRNAVTVVNFWFTTCGPCVGELAELDALNKELANTKPVKFTLLKTPEDYIKSFSLASSAEAVKFTANIFAYPTTYVVDRSGNIVGEPIVGAVTEKKQAETLQKLIDQVLAADMG